ncbi:predicted protein [Naegleria gruberi]|uniref:Predicted protein n=1 Tax=Naegleria gruberi TaxID=5762 RepID=D2W1V4_NAEGR|nr:uncharacterized protein NAEGRDRAFT_75282 [Naegleria gruberi]EFC36930.1 predicted protein [Naegleria gruberi]|eukprot:XP_002669674.1 predicted protein [Naegleria gruberi strain NEG-M]
MTKIEYPNLMEDSIVYNIQYFMGKDYVYLVDKKNGTVGSFSLNSGQLLVNYYSDHRGIRKFITGPVSSCHVVLTYDGTIFENGKEVVFFSTDPQPNILRAACCGRGSILASSHDLYARGDDNVFFAFSEKFGDYNHNVSATKFVHIAKFEHEIRDIQCGYFFSVVLLHNNELLACGYNGLNQSSWDSSYGEIKQFTKIQYSFGYIERFGCSSRGTWVVSGEYFDVLFLIFLR